MFVVVTFLYIIDIFCWNVNREHKKDPAMCDSSSRHFCACSKHTGMLKCIYLKIGVIACSKNLAKIKNLLNIYETAVAILWILNLITFCQRQNFNRYQFYIHGTLLRSKTYWNLHLCYTSKCTHFLHFRNTDTKLVLCVYIVRLSAKIKLMNSRFRIIT